MGYMTLSDFRTEVQSALGDRGFVDTRLDRWINFAYLDLCAALPHPELTEEDTTQSTANAVNSVNVPTGAMVVLIVRNTTDDSKMEWVPLNEYWRYSQTAGVASKWTRQKAKILLNPVPNSVKSLRIIYLKTPARLTAAGDVSTLVDTWDSAIFMLAVHFGLLAIGEENRAMAWLQRAVNYIQSRLIEGGMVATLSGLGLTLPTPTTGIISQPEG